MIRRGNNSTAQNSLLLRDPLARKQWFKAGMLEAGKSTFWNRYASSSFDGVIFHQSGGLGKDGLGNDITFDFDGFLTQAPLRGKTNLVGTGVTGKKFSCGFNTQYFHHTAALEGHWELSNIGSLDLRSQSKAKRQLFNMRARDVQQGYWDVAMGFGKHNTASHIIMPNTVNDIANLGVADGFNLALLKKISKICEVGGDCNIGGHRPQLEGWKDPKDKIDEWNTKIDLVVDYWALASLENDPEWRELHKINYRGSKNPLLSGEISGYQNINFVYGGGFKGSTHSRMHIDSAVNNPGMRTIDKNSMKFTGEEGWDRTAPQIGNAFVLGKGAMIGHSAMAPIPVTAENLNHSQYQEIGIHYYTNAKRTRLIEHNGDYEMLKKSDYDLGILNINYYIGDI